MTITEKLLVCVNIATIIVNICNIYTISKLTKS